MCRLPEYFDDPDIFLHVACECAQSYKLINVLSEYAKCSVLRMYMYNNDKTKITIFKISVVTMVLKLMQCCCLSVYTIDHFHGLVETALLSVREDTDL